MSASVWAQTPDQAQATDYRLQADDMRAQATNLTYFAAQLVEEHLPLHDSSPRRRAGLAAAQAFRQAANAYTDAAEQYDGWAADLDVQP